MICYTKYQCSINIQYLIQYVGIWWHNVLFFLALMINSARTTVLWTVWIMMAALLLADHWVFIVHVVMNLILPLLLWNRDISHTALTPTSPLWDSYWMQRNLHNTPNQFQCWTDKSLVTSMFENHPVHWAVMH